MVINVGGISLSLSPPLYEYTHLIENTISGTQIVIRVKRTVRKKSDLRKNKT